MFKFLVNYNFTPDKEWIGDDYLIHDRSDDGIDHLAEFDKSKVVYEDNVGNADYSKLNYLIDNYYDLPDVFLWGKTNLFKYITPEEYDEVKDNQFFTPLLTKNHKVYTDYNGWVCYYSEGIYWERNPMLYSNDYKYFMDYSQFAHAFMLPSPPYIPFFPGGNCILTKERVHRYGIAFYEKLASILPYQRVPLEANFCERAYYTMFK